MRARRFVFPLAFVLASVLPAFAQEASMSGTVLDGTKAALPGATITATSLETGRVTTAVSDERGEYRLRALLPGRYKVEAELAGFAAILIPEVELLVGQNRHLPLSMQLASVAETLTITG
ncbi:MAG: carboxypeptidase-like regulatory domain-containing protein, partial [Vicinamibacterales bacterium]